MGSKRKIKWFVWIIVFLICGAYSQKKFTPEDYKKALWMVTRFYGAQRSGKGPNWLIMQHDTVKYRESFTRDADGSYDLEGGWFDCGDHVTFGNTFFYSAYVLAKAYEMFPEGFHDLYNGFDYKDYVESNDWDITGGKPDGIPDLLQELKYATNWIIKATPNSSTFYYQKGEGSKDHATWVTAGKMSYQPPELGGEPRKVFKNPNDGVMPSMAAAALAVMSRIYKKYDEDYSRLCLEHAKYAYEYATPRKNSSAGAGDGGFYGPHSQPAVVAYITAASEMYATTKEEKYKNDAKSEESNIKFHNWGMDYANTHDLAPAAMATCGVDEKKLDLLKTMFIDVYTKSTNSEGVCTRGNRGWGALRYPANHAFIAAIWAKAKKDSSLDQFIFKQVDYIMGANNSKLSFIVGFCSGCSKEVKFPHHRNVYLRDDDPSDEEKRKMVIPQRNRQFGSLVGGSWESGSFKDDVVDYAMTEGGIDYNAGLVGALGYIVSKLTPADTSKMVGIRNISFKKKDILPYNMLIVNKNEKEFVITFNNKIKIISYVIYSMKGSIIDKKSFSDGREIIKISKDKFCKGVYIVKVTTLNPTLCISSRRIIYN
ncbi:MAG: glycoside hydrolase family 9 protein [Chitinispirillaceae bacterium]|nr:glycoside hydrolase family 9 protein [Chitinispirillaceae bacterium]